MTYSFRNYDAWKLSPPEEALHTRAAAEFDFDDFQINIDGLDFSADGSVVVENGVVVDIKVSHLEVWIDDYDGWIATCFDKNVIVEALWDSNEFSSYVFEHIINY